MAERNRRPDQQADLERVRAAARVAERASAQVAAFAERVSAVVGPAEMVEYDTLIAREAAAISDRVEAFGGLGLGAASLDATGPPDA